MSDDKEYEEAFNATLTIDILKNDLATNKRIGKIAEGRYRRKEEALQVENNKLTSPQRQTAIMWEHRVIALAWQIFRAKQQFIYNDLLGLSPKTFIGRGWLGQAQYTKSKKDKLQMSVWLDSPQGRDAIATQRKIIYSEPRILREVKRRWKLNQQTEFEEILNAVMELPGVPDEVTVRRCLNKNGFKGASGRKKTANNSQ